MTRFHAISIDANDVERIARFWCDVAGYDLHGDGLPYFAELRPANDTMPRINVMKVPETKTVKNRVHIEFAVDDLDAERERLEGLGASFDADRKWEGFRWLVMQDPEGNEFCLTGGNNHE